MECKRILNIKNKNKLRERKIFLFGSQNSNTQLQNNDRSLRFFFFSSLSPGALKNVSNTQPKQKALLLYFFYTVSLTEMKAQPFLLFHCPHVLCVKTLNPLSFDFVSAYCTQQPHCMHLMNFASSHLGMLKTEGFQQLPLKASWNSKT